MISDEENKAIENLNKRLTIEKYTKNIGTPVYISDLQIALNLIQNQQEEIKKLNKMIDEMLQEFTDCEFELKCSECCIECERDYDQLYICNKQYFENKVGEKNEDT